ncbi:DNA gyrase inhibitor YacG [Marinobacter sp. JSM 1782161]|uniref:DNA gyrase inhibitor YacG n=1 Tax=Marinobacter sp. JSM 1782161 TaxID=2685906 RepID=UPI00140391C5|nr:DNA gyrase inhibitor YacG [Marinobacter sp. JSM 1782161]
MLVTCPTCKTEAEWDTKNPYRPFCCERCKLIDLGAWANEDYRIPAEDARPDDLPDDEDDTDLLKH